MVVYYGSKMINLYVLYGTIFEHLRKIDILEIKYHKYFNVLEYFI